MSKKFKKPMIVFFILSIVALVGWLAVKIVLGLNNVGFDFAKVFTECFAKDIDFIKNCITFKYGFAPAEGKGFDWLYSYILCVALAFILVLIIVGIVVSAKRKKKGYIWYVIAMLAVAYVVADAISQLGFACKEIDGYAKYFDPAYTTSTLTIGGRILSIAIPCCAGLAFIFMLFTYFFALAHAKACLAPEAAQEEIPEIPQFEEVPAEEAAIAATTNEEIHVEEVIAAENPTEVAPTEEAPKEEVKPEEVSFFDHVAKVEPVAALDNSKEVAPVQVADKPVNDPALQESNFTDFMVEPESSQNLTRAEITAIIKEAVKEIVSETAQNRGGQPFNQTQNITGATFGGPLIVQYFNGQCPTPAPLPQPQPAPVAAPTPAPVPAPVEEPVETHEEEIIPEPAPVEEEPVVVAPVEAPAKNPIIRIPFQERMINAEKEMKSNYNELKNEFLSWGLKSRVSNSGDTFRLHRKTYAKLTIAGKSLKLYFALDPKDYADSTIPVQDASSKECYAEIPLIFKVKSPLSMRRCKELIQTVCEKDGLEQGEVESINWVKELTIPEKNSHDEDDD